MESCAGWSPSPWTASTLTDTSQHLMDRLRALATFKAVVEHRSFAKAANALGLTPPAVTRHVQDLEALLGVRLLNRSARSITATPLGAEVLARAVTLLVAYEELEGVASLGVSEARGVVRLAAPDFCARRHLGVALASYLSSNPQVSIELRLRPASSDALDDDVDLSLCLDTDLRPSLIARRVAAVSVAAFASTTYLVRKGVPRHPSDLAAHDCLTWEGGRSGAGWCFRHVATGEQQTAVTQGTLRSTSAEFLVHAAAHGAGVVIAPVLAAEEAVASATLQPLLPDWGCELSLYLAYRSRQHQPLSVRRLVDHLVRVLGQDDAIARPALPMRPQEPGPVPSPVHTVIQ